MGGSRREKKRPGGGQELEQVLAGESRLARRVRGLRGAIQIAFFLSGLAGLVYEVIWLRILTTVFGNTNWAVSVTLTAFMSGLALGSYVFGRLADRHPRPFRLYGILEILVGVYCVASPALLYGVRSLYLVVAHHVPFESPLLTVLQFVLSLLVLIIPTAFMGGTLPILTKGFTRRLDHLGRAVGDLYAVNTFGAAAGIFLGGFILLPTLGLQLSTTLTALLNVTIGVAIIVLERRVDRSLRETGVRVEPSPAPAPPAPSPPPSPAGEPDRSDRASPRFLPGLLLVGFGISGFAALALEVAWTRALILVIGSSVYAFATILTCYLAGIALGSWIFARAAGQQKVTAVWFGVIELGIGFSALVISWVLGRMPYLFFNVFQSYSENYASLVAVEFALVFMLLLVATLLMGMTFPVLARVYITDRARLGGGIGKAYAANTVGAIAGAFLAGFVLIPILGVRATMLLCCAAYMAVGVVVLALGSTSRTSRIGAAVAAVAGVVTIALVPAWSQELMNTGVFLQRYTTFAEGLSHRIVFYRDGATATVAVAESVDEDGFRDLILSINGKPDASSSADRFTQLLSGHLPMLLADHPKDVLVIGLGSGVTVGAVGLYDIDRLDCVEIEPAVKDAASYFRDYNRDIVNDPRVNWIMGDARNYVAATTRRYDVITSEPSNPWVAGISSLFTVEHLEAQKALLKPNGVVCQWIHTYSMSSADLRLVFNTFRRVFPHTTLWASQRGDVLMLAGDRPLVINYAALDARIKAHRAVRDDLASLTDGSALGIISCYLLGEQDLGKLVRGARLNTDNLPLLEFSAPRSLYRDTYWQNSTMIARARTQGLPAMTHFDRARYFDDPWLLLRWAQALSGRGDVSLYTSAIELLQRAERLDPTNGAVLIELAGANAGLRREQEAQETLDRARRADVRLAEAETAYFLGHDEERLGNRAAARRNYAVAVRLVPEVELYREAFRRVGGPADWPPPQPPKPGTAP